LKDPQLLRETGWTLVDIAWSIEGDISYLDYSWMWGGSSYPGVYAQYYGNSLESPYEVIFFYSGQSLPPGTVLWQYRNPNPSVTVAFSSTVPQFTSEVSGNCGLSLSIWILTILRILAETNAIGRLRKYDLEIYV
jgi:hypothetical protein